MLSTKQWNIGRRLFALAFLSAILSLFFSVQESGADGSCAARPGTVDRLACDNAPLQEALARMQRALTTVAGALEAADRQALMGEQESWKRRPLSACDLVESAELAAPEKRDCIARQIDVRIGQIEDWSWQLGRSRAIPRDAETKPLCDRALARANIRWRWTEGWRDSYEIGIFPGASEPAWRVLGETSLYEGSLVIQEAAFDFDNSGVQNTVFAISTRDTRTTYPWYIVAAADEAESLRQRLQSILKENDPSDGLNALAADLQFPVSDRPNSLNYGTPFVREDGRAPTLKSRLYSVSNNDTYDGSRVQSRIVVFDRKTYVLAGSVGNTGDASVAVFRPRQDGGMRLTCSHKAIPSHTEPEAEITDKTYACPVDLQQRRVPWQGDKMDVQTAVLDLPEWGGSRPVTQWSGSVGPELRTRLSIGGVGATEADTAGDWPMSSVDEDHQDTVELLLTEAGPYVEATSWIAAHPTDDRQVSSLFYRIVGDTLSLVCKETEVVVAPPGYAQGGEK